MRLLLLLLFLLLLLLLPPLPRPRDEGQLDLDVGAFTSALEFASERQAVVCGKPGKQFFEEGLKVLGLTAEEVGSRK